MRTIQFFSILMLSLSVNSQTAVFDWAKQMGGSGYDVGTSITLDASGNVYTIGSFTDTVDFDPGAGVSSLTSNGSSDIFIQKLDANGNLLWVKQIGGTGFDHGISIALDASGNVYTVGIFSTTVDFNPGAGVSNLTSNGSYDIFIQKLDANGDFLWVKQIGGVGDDYGNSITFDANGNIYTAGSFQNTVDFDPGSGVSYLTSNGGHDIFIEKLDASGNFLWVKQMGDLNNDRGISITLDGSGNIHTTGNFQGTVDFNPGAGVSNLTSTGYGAIFIQKLDSNGNFVWVKQMGAIVNSSALDASGNVYTIGFFLGTVDFDPGVGVFNLISNGYEDIFIQKLDANGDFLWVKQIGGTYEDYGNSITLDATGNVYTTGSFGYVVDFDPGTGVSNLTSNGSSDIFIQKLDANGNFLWVKQMGGTDQEYGVSISIDASGNVYTTGVFSETVDFDPGAGVSNLTSNGFDDIFIQKLKVAGVGIIENDFGTEFLLYPNPTDGFFSIDFGKPYDATITITDLTGKIILTKTYTDSQLINLKLDEPTGVYLLIVESAEKKAVIKLVKE